jgi:hypothetical protein
MNMKSIAIIVMSTIMCIQPTYGMLGRAKTYFQGKSGVSAVSRTPTLQRTVRQTGRAVQQTSQSPWARFATYVRSFTTSPRLQFTSSTPTLSWTGAFKSIFNPAKFKEDQEWLANFGKNYRGSSMEAANRGWGSSDAINLKYKVKEHASAINAKNKYEISDMYGAKSIVEQTPLHRECEEALGLNLIRGFDKNKPASISIDAFMQNMSKPYDEVVKIFVKNGAYLSKPEQENMLSSYFVVNTVFNPIRFKQLIGLSRYSMQTEQEKKFDSVMFAGDGLMQQGWEPLANIMKSVSSLESVPLEKREQLQQSAQPTIADITKVMLENYLAKAEKSIQMNDANFLMNEASARLLNFREDLLSLDAGNKKVVSNALGGTTTGYTEYWEPAYAMLAGELAEANTLLLTNQIPLEELSNVISDNMNKVMSMRKEGEVLGGRRDNAEEVKKLYHTRYDISPATLFDGLKKRVEIIRQRIANNECGTEFDQQYYKKMIAVNPDLHPNKNIMSKPIIVPRLEPEL